MRFLKYVILAILVITLCIVGFHVFKGYNMYKSALEDKPLEEMVQEVRNKDNFLKFDELPTMYKNAVIAVEDHRFYNHKGIDIISIGRALFNNLKQKGFYEGGSTITQQLAKNMYFTQDKSFQRKIAEMFMAKEIEKNYSKEEIFELYANTSYFGDGCYTVKGASLWYFKKEPKEMTDYECTLLAGIPNAPSIYAPTQNPELAKQRQKHVLNKMVQYNYLTQEEADKIIE